MLVNPTCPTCKNNRRVISSHKRVAYNPGRVKRFVVSSYIKIVNVCTWIVNKAMSAVNHIQRPRFLFKCSICHKEFQGTRQERGKKK